MRLLRVELTRFATRRAVVVVVLATVVLTFVMVAAAAYNTRPANGTEEAAAERLMERQEQLNEADYADCVEDPEGYFGTVSGATCDSLRPELQWFLPRPALELENEVTGRGRVLVVLLAGMAVLAGAFFAGRDWTTGSMTTQLLHEPRRTRVWLTKALAVMIGTTVVAATMLVVFWGGLGLFAEARGSGASADDWRFVAETSGRSLALVAAVALGGFALTMGMRHTVATVGLLFGYAVVGEALAASLPFERMSQWSLANNLLAWVHDGYQVRDRSLCAGTAEACSSLYTLSLEHAAAYLGGLLLLAVVVSLVTFRRRDVP